MHNIVQRRRSTLALIIAMHLRSSFVSGLGLIASYSDAMPSAPPPPALRVFGEVSVFVTSYLLLFCNIMKMNCSRIFRIDLQIS